MKVLWRGGWLLRGLLLLLLLTSPLYGLLPAAADAANGSLKITRLDTSRAPEITAHVVVEDGAGNPVTGLAASQFQVFENGKPVTRASVVPEKVSIQVGVMIDAGENINQPGLTGESRIDEVRDCLGEFLLHGPWLDSTGRGDWVNVMAQDKALQVLTQAATYPSGWTNDYQLAYNQVYLYNPRQPSGADQLAEAIAEGIDRMPQAPAEVGLPGSRALLVLADANASIDSLELQDLLAAAKKAGVAIYPVLLGQGPDESKAAGILELAAQTGGRFAHYNGTGSMANLYQAIAARHNQYRLQYRMLAAGNHDLQIQATIDAATGIPVKDEVAFMDNLAPPTITLAPPTQGNIIEKNPAVADANLALSLQITWPAGETRGIAEVRQFVDQTPAVLAPAPFNRLTLPLAGLADGTHSLRAELTDEFGLQAVSAPITVEVRSLKPLAVTVSLPAADNTIWQKPAPWWAALFSGTGGQPDAVVLHSAWQPVDGHARGVVKVAYVIDGQSYAPDAGNLNQFHWYTGQLAEGMHSVQVRVQDDLGLVAESSPLSVNVRASAAPLSLPILMIVLLVLLNLMWLVLYARQGVGKTALGKVRRSNPAEATQARRVKPAETRAAAAAHLIVEEGDRAHPEPIPLVSANTRIGRDEGLVNLRFEDRTVSRLHAHIRKEADGTFRIYDEGSTSATYVNYQMVPISGQLLQQDDIIHLGRVRLRFCLGPINGGDRTSGEQARPEPANTAGQGGRVPAAAVRHNGHGSVAADSDDFTTEPFMQVLLTDSTPPGAGDHNTEPFGPARGGGEDNDDADEAGEAYEAGEDDGMTTERFAPWRDDDERGAEPDDGVSTEPWRPAQTPG